MFSEILNILPRLDEKDMKKMQISLQSRFTKIAKSFGNGLLNAIKGGGIIGLGAMLANKLLNPLKETQAIIDQMLKDSDDVVTNAAQFESATGNLVKLQALAKATGLEPESLNVLLTKYQTAVAEARQDPNKQTSVRNFVGEKDTVAGFFQYIQGLQLLSKDDQVLAQKEVFGEKQILKMSDFLQSDFKKLFMQVGGPNNNLLGAAAEKNAKLNDFTDILSARRDLEDLVNKANLMNIGMVFRKDKSERTQDGRENQRIATYGTLAGVQDTIDNLMAKLEKTVYKEMRDWTVIFQGISKIMEMQGKLSDLKKSAGIKEE